MYLSTMADATTLKGAVDVGGQGTGQEGLAGAGRAVQEDALGGLFYWGVC